MEIEDKIQILIDFNKKIKLKKEISTIKLSLFRSGDIKSISFPPLQSLDKHDRIVDIPSVLTVELRNIIYLFLQAKEEALIKEIQEFTIS